MCVCVCVCVCVCARACLRGFDAVFVCLLQPMRVHVSEETATMLEGTAFMLEARGSVEVKVRVSHFCTLHPAPYNPLSLSL